MESDEFHRIPIDGILDLHTFAPRDVKSVVEAYIEACLEERVYSIRIIHGKGRGVQRDIVRSILEKNPDVAVFRTDPGASGWGATLVDLRRPAEPSGQ